jgi:hypothetical protein
MSKLKIVLITASAVLVTNAAQFALQGKILTDETTKLTDKIVAMQSSIDALGPIATCYTPTAPTFPGQEITEGSIKETSVPASFVNAAFALNKAQIIGKYFKIGLAPGTPITADTVMENSLDDTARETDMTGNRRSVGLKEGDYIDYRITYPYGEDFVVLPHLRVMSVAEQSLKVYLNETELHRYQAALVDFFLNRSRGADVYVTKYVEPGIRQPAKAYYSVPLNIEAIILIDPNIAGKAAASPNKELRPAIEGAIGAGTDEDGGELNGGRSELNGKINDDYFIHKTAVNEAEQNSDGFTEAGSEQSQPPEEQSQPE